MRILHVGASGTVGQAVSTALRDRGHEVVGAHPSSRDHPVDITDHESIRRLIDDVGELDAVVCTAGKTPFGPWGELDRESVQTGMNAKFFGQVELVRQAATVVRTGGSFTLVSGILGREPIRTGSIAAAANGAVEAWVRASALELWGKYRINAVSPTTLVEHEEKMAELMPGYPVVDSADVGKAFVRSVESMEMGRIYIL